MAPIILLVVMLVTGASCLVAGVFLLSGPGWALIAAAVQCLVIAVVLVRGLRRTQTPKEVMRG